MGKEKFPKSATRMATMKDMVGRLDPRMEGCDDDPAYRTAIVLLAAACLGPSIDGLVACTGYDKEFITEIADRMHLAGLWSNMSVRYRHWLADDEDTIQPSSFWADVLVAEGLLTAQPEGPTRIRYWPIEQGQ